MTFGGKTVLLGGDFRQTLPVIPRGNKVDTVLASISHSYLWHSCHKFSLKTNMRLNQEEKEFSDWLIQVGEGRVETDLGEEYDNYNEQMISVDDSLIRECGEDALREVVNAAYGEVHTVPTSQSYYTDRAILTPRNETVDEINAYTSLILTEIQKIISVSIASRYQKLRQIKTKLFTRWSISIP